MSNLQPQIARLQSLIATNELAQAVTLARRLVQQYPREPDAFSAAAFALLHAGQLEPAVFHATRATELGHSNPGPHFNLGILLSTLGRETEAAKSFEKALSLRPDWHAAAARLLMSLVNSNQLARATRLGPELLQRFPGDPLLSAWTANAIFSSGRPESAAAMLRAVLATNPDRTELLSALAITVPSVPKTDAGECLDVHRRLGTIIEQSEASVAPLSKPRPRTPNAPLRVAFLSPDFRAHPVGSFVEPLLRHFDRAKLHITCFFTGGRGDAITNRLKPLASSWREITSQLPPRKLAELIAADAPDILIELSGHSVGHDLSALVHRPAPMQVTYLGYPSTTGLRAIDARIVDSITDPPGSEGWCSERLIHLDPCFLCYQPPADPQLSMSPGSERADALAPAGRDGGITFGSFNAVHKLNESTISLWSQLLARISGSRLVLKAMAFSDPLLREDTIARFEQAGAPRGQVSILSPLAAAADHLAAYQSIDIALDPTPYNATTTTCEALWMGVPVITLRGDRHAARVGASLLSAAGLPDLIAEDEAQYLDIAAALAADSSRRASLRTTLRSTLACSPLCDGNGFARRFESAVESLVFPSEA